MRSDIAERAVQAAIPYVTAAVSAEAAHSATLRRLVTDGLVDHYYVGGVSRDRGIGTGHLLLCNWPEDYRATYYAERWYAIDPIVRFLRGAHGMVLPGALADAFRHSVEDQRMLDAMRAAGLALPLCFVIGPPAQVVGCITFRRAEPYGPQELALLSLLAPMIHRAARLTHLGRGNRAAELLSPRERECIAWSSLGKSSWEIGEILGIAKQTVDVHLKSAIQKLNAGSRAHAVAEALRLGLID